MIAAEGNNSAYVFVRNAGVWTQQGKLLPNAPNVGSFGAAVAIDGDTVIVGAPFSNIVGLNSGAAFVFTRSANVWTKQAQLGSPNVDDGDLFGHSVAIDADTAIIGASFDSDLASHSGSAHVFKRIGDQWSAQVELHASDGTMGDDFGWSVAISGDTALIGAMIDDEVDEDAGSAYVFVETGGIWTEQAKLIGSGTSHFDKFGGTVALQGDLAVIGAHFDEVSVPASGAVTIFKRTSGAWIEQTTFAASDAETNDWFGWGLGISGNSIAVSAYANDDAGTNSGSAYVFMLGPPGLGDPCFDTLECQTGLCVDGVCCETDCGGGVTDDCVGCSISAGSSVSGDCQLLPAGHLCRPPASSCDAAEACGGASAACPADAVAPSGTTCRDAAGPCDIVDNCDGVSLACPPDAVVPGGVVCRVAVDVCDIEEGCDGTTPMCPIDAHAPVGQLCRDAAGVCDVAETCNGLVSCPPDAVAPVTTVCRAASDVCDAEEACDGQFVDCPPDALVGRGEVCRPPTDTCDETEACAGAEPSCPPDADKDDGAPCPGGECQAGVCVADSGDGGRAGGEGVGGAGGAAAATGGGGAAVGGAGGLAAQTSGVHDSDDGGCACASGGSRNSSRVLTGIAAALALWVRRRRRPALACPRLRGP